MKQMANYNTNSIDSVKTFHLAELYCIKHFDITI